MPKVVEIRDLNLPELDAYARLTESQLRNRQNAQKGRFIAESAKVIECALRAGCTLLSLLMTEHQLKSAPPALLEACEDACIYVGDEALLMQLTGYRLTRGILAEVRRPVEQDYHELCATARRIAVLEDIVDPTNVGAIFRSAAALGMDALLLSPGCCDPLHRRAARVSMGTVLQLPWARLDVSGSGIPNALREMGIKSAALALKNDSVAIDDLALTREPRLALLLGTEGTGLLDETIAACDYTALIPMQRGVDSLNVAAAAAVAFWCLRK